MMPPITRPDMIGSGHNSPEAWIMWEQLGHVGNSPTGEAYQRIQETNETQLIDVTGNDIYIGYAVAGTLESASNWKIKRVNTVNPISIKWADASTLYNKKWDDRATYNYS
jgi:hypothetical protein